SGTGQGVGPGAEIQYTARAAARRIVSAHITVGTRLPAYPTSMGRVLLAGMPETERQLRDLAPLAPLTPHTVTDPAAFARVLTEVRKQGYALVSEELEEGLRSIAVPVRDRTGRVVAAVNVAMHTTRRTAENCVTEVLPELYGTASRIEGELRTAGRFTRVPLA
ncbi:IclR family transcriptional regulator domain-containing protein, partial [Streptomyces reticuliscabiei]